MTKAVNKIRINKFIAANSKFSRREVDTLIQNKKIKINGKQLSNLGEKIDPSKDKITVYGKIIKEDNKAKIYIALNKKKGYITTRKDELNRKTVMQLVPKIENLKAIGRLDKETEGLLLFSNDGEFINKITHPRFNLEKEYYVQLDKKLEEKDKTILEKGIIIDNIKLQKSKIKIIKGSEILITIYEGRNRQIRKMFKSQGYTVKYLKRIRIKNLKLKKLKLGTYRKLTIKEINDLNNS